MRTITVVGAGFSGLVTAYYLSKRGLNVRLVESGPRAGGMLGTIRTEHGLVETAANGIRNSARLEALCEDLRVPLQSTRNEARARFIYRGAPRRWPLKLSDVFRLLIRSAANARELRPRPFETVMDWGTRVIGAGATEYFLAPALGGVYAGDPRELSASLIFRTVVLPDELKAVKPDKAKQHGTVAPPEGMQQLIDGLRNFLEQAGVDFSLNQRARLTPGDPTVICTSARAAAELLSEVEPNLAGRLHQIKVLPLLTATCFYSRPAGTLKGFGCLFARGEGFRALGVLMNSFIFDGRGPAHSETWMFGGALDSRILELSDDDLRELIADERRNLYGRKEEALAIHLTRWPEALPHYSIELERILTTLPPAPRDLALVGNYLGRIGLTGIIERAAQVAERLGNQA